MKSHLAVVAFALVLGIPVPAQTRHTFDVDDEPRTGLRYLLARDETIFEEYRVRAGERSDGETRNRTIELVAEIEVVAVRGNDAVEIEVSVRRAVLQEDGLSRSLDLEGCVVRGLGAPGRRRFRFVDGTAMTPAQRAFLADQFGGSGSEPGPRQIFGPTGPVQIGDTWDIPVEALLRHFGLEAGSMVSGRSMAQATLLDVQQERGNSFGLIEVDISLVPTRFDTMRVRGGEIRIEGVLLLPLDGSVPGGREDFDLDLDLEAEGSEDGLRIEVTMEMRLSGVEEREALERRR